MSECQWSATIHVQQSELSFQFMVQEFSCEPEAGVVDHQPYFHGLSLCNDVVQKSGSDKSATIVLVWILFRLSSWCAKSSILFLRRASRTRFNPMPANCTANSFPMPANAPVTSAHGP